MDASDSQDTIDWVNAKNNFSRRHIDDSRELLILVLSKLLALVWFLTVTKM